MSRRGDNTPERRLLLLSRIRQAWSELEQNWSDDGLTARGRNECATARRKIVSGWQVLDLWNGYADARRNNPGGKR
jgi:hypothetical protein